MPQSDLSIVKFIYFDLDDTLLDHKSAQATALRKTVEEIPYLQHISLNEFQTIYHQRNEELWDLYNNGKISKDDLRYRRIAETLEAFEVDKSRFQEVENVYMRHYEQSWDWVDGAREAYHTAKQQVPVGIITNGFLETQYKKLEKFGFLQDEAKTIISEEVGYLKPHPRIFEYAVEQAGVKPHEVLYVGDSYNSDIQGGHAAGLKTAWYINGHQINQNGKADIVFDDFNKFSLILQNRNQHS